MGTCSRLLPGTPTLSIIQEEKLDKNAEKMGKILLDGMEGIKDRRKIVGDARGKGLMLAIELVKDRKTKGPAPEVARATLQAAMKRGLLISTAGTYGNDIRLLPPLNINEEEANQALDVLDESLKAVTSK